MTTAKIIWTKVDEAPALATYALLPVVRAFTRGTGDRGRDPGHLARRPDHRQLPGEADRGAEDPRRPDARSASSPGAPRPTSSSCPTSRPRSRSCVAAIEELQEKGYDIPDYPEEPKDRRRDGRCRSGSPSCLGSAVNPVLREGNSDRRPAVAVKKFAQKNPHRMMKPWPESGSKSRVAHMTGGDFYGTETLDHAREAHRGADRVRRRRRHDHGAEGAPRPPGGRGHRHRGHERHRAPRASTPSRSRPRSGTACCCPSTSRRP